jgi:hypothetical protein
VHTFERGHRRNKFLFCCLLICEQEREVAPVSARDGRVERDSVVCPKLGRRLAKCLLASFSPRLGSRFKKKRHESRRMLIKEAKLNKEI